MSSPALLARSAVTPLVFALALLTTLAMTLSLATPADAKGHRTIRVKSATCFTATESAAWGGIAVALRLDKRLPPEGEPYLVVVDDAEGNELDRFFADAPRYRPTFRIAGDGLTTTPHLVITASVGGDVLGRTRVSRTCGTLNPNPHRGPAIESVTVVGCDVSVTVANPSDDADMILVALWPEGSNVAPLRFVDLPSGGTGTVTFEAQGTGTYSADAESVTTFLSTETPFDIVVPEGCVART